MADLLCCFAHPDDETFTIGATIARHASRGVAIACATRGEAGRVTALPGASPDVVGQVREGELRAAAALLGAGEVDVLGFPDGGLAVGDPDALVGAFVRMVRRTRPRVMVTFGPEGAPTGHRDHRAVSRAATAAWFLAALPTAYPECGPPHRTARLFYFTWAPPRPEDELQLHGVPADLCIPAAPHRDAKWQAFLAHASQRHHEARFRQLSLDRDEYFALASGVPLPAGSADLFAGL